MGDITKNLSRHEFACKCGCGLDTIDFSLPFVIQETRDIFQSKYPSMDVRIDIHSAGRCRAHNKSVGGKVEKKKFGLFPIPLSGSMHLYFIAVDFHLYDKKTGKMIDIDEVYYYLDSKYPTSCGIGRYNSFIHFDTRKFISRWDYR